VLNFGHASVGYWVRTVSAKFVTSHFLCLLIIDSIDTAVGCVFKKKKTPC